MALVVAAVILNLNVTGQGDPLSSVGLSAGPTTAGITDGAKTVFYASLMISGVLLASVGLATAIAGRAKTLSALVVRTYGGVAMAQERLDSCWTIEMAPCGRCSSSCT